MRSSQRRSARLQEAHYWALSSPALIAGRWQVLLTSLFLHGSWPHVLMNSVAMVALGPPAARLMGTDLRGASALYAF